MMSEQALPSSRRSWLATLVVVLIAGALAFAFREPLRVWFAPLWGEAPPPPSEAPTPTATPEAHHEHRVETTPVPVLPEAPLPDAVLTSVRAALEAYERLRAALVADRLDPAAARDLADRLHEATEGADPPVAAALRQAHDAAMHTHATDDVTSARTHFATISAVLIALGDADPRMTEGLFVFECPMTEGWNRWVQTSDTLDNPYMGTSMPRCGSRSTWDVNTHAAAIAPSPDEVAYYTCPMHPSVRADVPGSCPICGMDLTPVTQEELRSGTSLLDEDRRRRIGLELETVRRHRAVSTVRAFGRIVPAESAAHDVDLRVGGWIRRLHADATGEIVRRGQVLFTLYSPELLAAQKEYLSARGHAEARSAEGGPLRGGAHTLAEAARERLRLLGMTDAQVAELARHRRVQEEVPILAPASGYVLEKSVVAGSRVEPGMRTHRIAPLDRVWMLAAIQTPDLPYVTPGQTVRIEAPFLPEPREGVVDHVYPTIDPTTRTGTARVVLDNPGLALRPEAYVDATLTIDHGERLLVPVEAVLYTGPRRIVFVDVGHGRLQPREVDLGVRTDLGYEVRGGLEEGERVVTSGNFLVAAESRLKSAGGLWSEGASHGSH